MPMPLDGDPLPGLRFTDKPFPATLVDGCASRPTGNQAAAGGPRPLESLFREGEGKRRQRLVAAVREEEGGAAAGGARCPRPWDRACVCVWGGRAGPRRSAGAQARGRPAIGH